jgi:hypothetical protein
MVIALQIVFAVLVVVGLVGTAIVFLDKGVKRYESSEGS